MRKALYLAVTAAVLIGLFLAFAPKKAGESPPAPGATTTAPAPISPPVTSPAPAVPAGITATAPVPAASETAEPAAQPPPAGSGTLVELKVQQGRLVSGPEIIKLTEGDKLTLRVTSDTGDEMHLHGYNLHLDLTAGQTGELSFTANRSGRFEYELHHAHTALGVIEVYPR